MKPLKIGYFHVDGDPELDQYYTVVFGLQDEKYRWIVEQGIATLVIMDSKNKVLYRGERRVDIDDYFERDIPRIGRIPVVIWDVLISGVERGVPDILGNGKAIIYFKLESGEILYKGVRIPIPKATAINIENLFVKTDPLEIMRENMVFLIPQYRSDTVFYGECRVKLVVRLHRAEQITIHDIHVEPEQVEIVEVKPELPVVVDRKNTLNLYITLKPLREYKGLVTITLKTIAIHINYHLLRR